MVTMAKRGIYTLLQHVLSATENNHWLAMCAMVTEILNARGVSELVQWPTDRLQ